MVAAPRGDPLLASDPRVSCIARYLSCEDTVHRQFRPGSAHIILALGCHDLRVAERAAELMMAGVADRLVVAGGFGVVTKDIWTETEACKFERVALEAGVDARKIIREDFSTNTTENFLFSRKMLEEHNVHVKKVVLVCRPYMARRALATAGLWWDSVEWCVTYPELSVDQYPANGMGYEETIALMVGVLHRIKVYPARGWQQWAHIPTPVWSAFESLVADGFDQFLARPRDVTQRPSDGE